MGVFDRIEKKLENSVSGAFARAFKGDVQPVEITARLQRELDSEAKLLNRDRKLVPNEFKIGLSQHDYDRLTPYSKTLNSEISAQLRDYAADAGYIFNGPVMIEYLLDASLPVGRFTVASAAVAGVAAPQVPPAPPITSPEGVPSSPRPTTLAVEVNGVRHPLTPPGITIGRGTDADLRINDPGVSRLHAKIGVTPDQQLYIEDLGSTNGVVVDGQRTRHASLRLGSRIEIGTTKLAIISPVTDA